MKKLICILALGVWMGAYGTGLADSTGNHFQDGQNLLKEMKYDKAVEAFNRALVDNPGSGEIYVELGFAYRLMNDFKKAKEAYSKAIELDPKDAGAHLRLGDVYQLSNMEDQAEREFAIYRRLTSDTLREGREYSRARKYQQAIEAFHNELALNPNSGEVYRELGFTYRLMKDYEKAKNAYLKAIELDPKDADAHLRLGEVYRMINMEERAEKEFGIYRELTSTP